MFLTEPVLLPYKLRIEGVQSKQIEAQSPSLGIIHCTYIGKPKKCMIRNY